jgi:hypothetical protein
MPSNELERGDRVAWRTPQGDTTGVVVRRVTGVARARGHVAHASAAEPRFEVRSDRTGRTAIHAPDALRRLR